jgi:hypothetical protein
LTGGWSFVADGPGRDQYRLRAILARTEADPRSLLVGDAVVAFLNEIDEIVGRA